MSKNIEHIKNLIKNDKLKEAIVELDYLCSNDEETELIIQSSRYSSIKKKIRLNTVKGEDGNIEINKIKIGLLELIKEIESTKKLKRDTVPILKKIRLFFTILLSLLGLFWVSKKLVITRIEGNNNIVNIDGKIIKDESSSIKTYNKIGDYNLLEIIKYKISSNEKEYVSDSIPIYFGQDLDICYDVSRNTKLVFEYEIYLMIDNDKVGHIYPIGLGNTWNKKIVEISNGLDIAEEKEPSYFTKTYKGELKLKTPNQSGENYMVILNGAVISVDQLFYFNGMKKSSSGDFWHLPFNKYKDLSNYNGGKLIHTYKHNDGREEDVAFPAIVICLNVL